MLERKVHFGTADQGDSPAVRESFQSVSDIWKCKDRIT